MKKIGLLIVFSFIALSIFSLNMSEIKNSYVNYIEQYNNHSEELQWFFEELKNMGLYKFYKTQMVGSAEYTDRPSYISKHLSSIAEEHKFTSLENEIAFAGFLAYVQSDLAGKSLKEETIRSLPAFYLALEEYSSYLQDTGFLYIKNTIAYSLGLVKETPNQSLTKVRMKNRRAKLEAPEYYIYEGSPDPFFDDIISKNKEILENGIKEISTMKITGEDLEIEIDDLASQVLSFVPDTIRNDTLEVINIFLNNAEIKKSKSWIRFVVYFILIILIYFLKNKNFYQWLFLGIAISEIVYILNYFDFSKDIITAFIYGSFLILAFSLILITMFFQAFGRNVHWLKRIINISLIVLFVLLMNIPLFKNIEEIKMENNTGFHNSIMQKTLLNDVLVYPYTFVNKDVAYIGSQLSAEYSDVRNLYNSALKKFLLDSGKNKILDYLNFEDGRVSIDLIKEGMYIENYEVYSKLTDNFKKYIDDFEKNSQKRYDNINKGLEQYNENVINILKYSDEDFKELLQKTLESKLIKSSVLINYKSKLLDVFSKNMNFSINVKPMITDWGTKVLLLLILGFLYFFLNEKLPFKIIGLTIMTIASILSFIKPTTIHILSEFKYPVLNAQTFSVNILFGFIMLIFTAFSGLLIIKFYKGR
ncbi:hypothetical protein SAMN02745164_01443 [Marinitoga hydrogenitolerans DSM 16785]|uniref:Uncharacterized protein n=1 Tax=Marinitoga hydrogenitolerans (strain DSM 16785 / JCM 12826 / AT1271) TaxID=1122195 RepID=A0A1M4XJU9_MARH1|nr:hypothetical protein [Marinitoga hydrogenitolerans]SHE93680.1 hypothetical protein SAMN02745164_01443 [Marinitoga hydrogenitolerans DSM 16785]